MIVGDQLQRRERVSPDGTERDVDDVVVEGAPAELAAGCAARFVAEVCGFRRVLRKIGLHDVGVEHGLQRVGPLPAAKHLQERLDLRLQDGIGVRLDPIGLIVVFE